MLAAVTNLAEYTVTELAFALKRTVEEAYGLAAGARRALGLQASRPRATSISP